MIINLIRQPITNHQSPMTNRPVYGTLSLPFRPDRILEFPTLENADYLIPEGTYPLRLTWSPRFKKLMPLIDEVPDREGIRIHMGTRPEHSQGCVLVSALALENIKSFINLIERDYEDETLYIQITQSTAA